MAFLSTRVARARLTASAAATQRVRELRAAGVGVVALTQGEPDFNTPDHIIEAAYRAMRAAETHYKPVDGTPELKAAIVDKFRRENGIECRPENVSVGAGAKQVLYKALMSTLEPGDEVPAWLAARRCSDDPGPPSSGTSGAVSRPPSRYRPIGRPRASSPV